MGKKFDYEIPPTKFILFTGAGFTKNFGGYLAREMWAEIHNRLQHTYYDRLTNYKAILKKTKEKFDYEELFEIVVKREDYKDDKIDFNECILDIYKDMDENIRDLVSNQNILNIDINGIGNLLKHFEEDGRGNRTSFFFTLNQDIYIERQFYNILHPLLVKTVDAITRIHMDGRMQFNNNFSPAPKEDGLKEKLKKQPLEREQFHYVKLHGSFNWKDSYGNNMMVIGTSKEKDIEKEPILNWYKDLFENVFSTDDCRLLIIGYGFRDPHINKIILKSIKKNRLRIYIICPTDPEVFKNETLKYIGSDKDKAAFWEAISAYYPYTFEKLFPFNKPKREYDKLIEQFFES